MFWFSFATASLTRELYLPSMSPPSYPLQYSADWMIRQKFADGIVVSSRLPYFSWSAERVPGPKLLDRTVMPISYCKARVRAYMTVQPVWPFSSSLGMPRVAPFPYVVLMNLCARRTISSAIEFLSCVHGNGIAPEQHGDLGFESSVGRVGLVNQSLGLRSLVVAAPLSTIARRGLPPPEVFSHR